VSPLHVAVDRRNQTFALACVGACDAGDRLFTRIDSRGNVIFSKELTPKRSVARLDLMALSKDGRVGLAGDRVAPDGTTQLTVAVFRRDGRLEWQAHDRASAHALDATFDTQGELVVVGAASGGGGLAVAFGPNPHRRIEWRFAAPDGSFERVRADAHGALSIAGNVGASNGAVQGKMWRLHRRGRLAWTYTSPETNVRFATPGVALAVDGDGNSALVSLRSGPSTSEGETVLRFVTTLLDAQGSVRWVSEVFSGVNRPGLLDAAFSSCGDITEFGRRQGSARIGGDFKTVRFDDSGGLLWDIEDDFDFPETQPAAMAIGTDDTIAEVGTVFEHLDQRPGTGWIAVYGNDGTLLSARAAPSVLVDVARDSADGIVTIGQDGSSTVVSRETESGTPH
jgi:hypothetical protein